MRSLTAVALANPDYLEQLYQQYQQDPKSVDEPWQLFFAGFELAADGGRIDVRKFTPGGEPRPLPRVIGLVHAYREWGHLAAHLDPLSDKPSLVPILEPTRFDITPEDLDRRVEHSSLPGGSGTVRELVERMQTTYCGTTGVEYLHIQDETQRRWLQERIESNANRPDFTAAERVQILDDLILAECFEQFLGVRYVTAKRFSLEGGDALIPAMVAMIERAGDLGVEEMVFGMPHRGRLTVLVNVLRKPYEMVLAEFEGAQLAREATGDGDVKYHLGYSRDHVTRTGKRVHLSLAANPSHLEAINPIIEGMVRAKQDRIGDLERSRVVPVLLHGDAAVTGQGVVSETLWLSELDAYRIGGTVHLIVNNQVGFTTPPESYRFTRYPSDFAKIAEAPIFHVNGDDPEAAVHAVRLAIAFRQTFKKDVVVDITCYRRHGHNELDEPRFTQPTMYQRIDAHPTAVTVYRQRLEQAGVITAAEVDQKIADFRETLDAAQSYARDFAPRQQIFAFGGLWKGLSWAGDDWTAKTAVPADKLAAVAAAFTRMPANFSPNPKVLKIMEQRVQMVESGQGIDWGCAEALAFGSLVTEGTAVRLTGQDSGRGTFSHRHAVLHDEFTGALHVPLDHVRDDQARFAVVDSMLSENAVLGFEFGYSLADPHKLVLWEAQFGDFANGAQVIIDQFITSAESKWQRMSGLVLLLPHGYEGQGPEHSSARLERYLQLCAENNVQVCNLTTPAQLFHALRRQMHRRFRKPLIIMTPKSLLRHKLAVSTLAELTDGSFQPMIDDIALGDAPEAGIKLDPARVERVILCSGKIYYALLAARRERQVETAALVRVEQLYPFPHAAVRAALERYSNATQIRWVQEEPWNMGGWHRMVHELQIVFGELAPRAFDLKYVGREEAASPATGSYKAHNQEESELVRQAFLR